MKKFYKRLKLVLGLVFVGALLLYVGLRIMVYTDAKSMAKQAVEAYQQNETLSLLAIVSSQNHPFEQRNKAIWALGVLKKKEALNELEQLVIDNCCQHNTEICQYELQKAILKIKGKAFKISSLDPCSVSKD